jgi:predicted metalloprotease with PDZ domain
MKHFVHPVLFLIISLFILSDASGQSVSKKQAVFSYTVSMPEPSNHLIHVELALSGIVKDSVDLKMPVWMPGYYQIMDYPEQVSEFRANTLNGKEIFSRKVKNNTWRIASGKEKTINIRYDVKAERMFVGNSWLDSTHCYIIPEATFMYSDGYLGTPVSIKVNPCKCWRDIATGLDLAAGSKNVFTAPDFDILYDSPFLIGNLEELPGFSINGIPHRFIAYNPGNFDRKAFMNSLEKSIKAGTEIIGDIPYSHYTFLGIGQGFGGIEHLNNTTVSFNGNNLDNNPVALQRVLLFLSHEYFHNYNVKRIRPFELGPFNYEKENRTNLLWVSEGLSVYYEYMMVRRSGMMSDGDLLRNLSGNITTFENDPGKEYQSLIQSSYNTWSDGPFGSKPGEADRAISYYEKGPIAGLIIDFAIRKATDSRKSLDDVMRLVYNKYYKDLNRGFTDAEFQQACEDIAGKNLSVEFEFVSTTKEIDYTYYLSYAGLSMSSAIDGSGRRRYSISESQEKSQAQAAFFNSWTNGK